MPWDKILPDRQTKRLKWFDYSQAGSYFVTIGTYKGQHAFGEVENGKMSINAAGQIAQAQWLKLSERFLGVQLDDYVIMPNHLHGIIIILNRTTIANTPERFRHHMQKMVVNSLKGGLILHRRVELCTEGWKSTGSSLGIRLWKAMFANRSC